MKKHCQLPSQQWDARKPVARLLALLLLALACLPFSASQPARAEELRLEGVQRDVASKWPDLSHLTTADLARRLQGRTDVLLIDVRDAAEFAVSHLDGAVQVSPGIWRSTFMTRYREGLKGKTVVFYCSVGVRSSRLASSLKDELLAAGATAVHNLDGGIFAWHNEARPLVDGKGETVFVHPYDAYWGRLLARRELTRTAPQP